MPVLIPLVAPVGESPYLDGGMLLCGVDVGNIPVPIEIVSHQEGVSSCEVRFHAHTVPYPSWIANRIYKNFFSSLGLQSFECMLVYVHALERTATLGNSRHGRRLALLC